jgi:YD repeat-containing protein
MSNILLKQVQGSLITPPASNYVKLFSNSSDNGLLYYMDSSGVPVAIGNGSDSYSPVTQITYSNLYNLSGNFATGSCYLITDFESIYDQPDFYYDGVPKSVLNVKGKYGLPYQPIIVMATSKDTLSPDAYQPFYPKDKIKYDFTWNKTELDHDAKGRITERIDSNGNKTGYDHRTIRFKRYQNYDRVGSVLGSVTDFNCVTGDAAGIGFSSLSVGDIILLDSTQTRGGDRTYTIGLKVKTTIDDTNIVMEVDSLYSGGVPGNQSLNSGSLIIPSNYSFSGASYTYLKATANGNFDSYKEIYFGQSDDEDFDDTVYTFTSIGFGASINSSIVNNTIADYSKVYLNITNNTLILPNNVFFGTSIYNNNITGLFYNNTLFNDFKNNNISNSFYNNDIFNGFYNNNIDVAEFSNNSISGGFRYNLISGQSFIYNILKDLRQNLINSSFDNNLIDNNFNLNIIKCDSFAFNTFGEDAINNNIEANFDNCTVLSGFNYNHIKMGCDLSSIDFTSSTIVYMYPQTKTTYRNADGDIKISYYDLSDTEVRDYINF